MSSQQEERITFDRIPQLVSDLRKEISDLRSQVAALVAVIDTDFVMATKAHKRICQSMENSEIIHQIVLGDPNDTYVQLFRHCPFIQTELLKKGYLTPDELTE